MDRLRQRPSPQLADAFARVRLDLDVPDGFPAEVLHEARAAARRGPLPAAGGRVDHTHVPFCSIDPEGSLDLDQALHLERRPDGGYRLRYAIADVAAWVEPGGALDAEARRRGLTLYLPDGKAPLHPEVLSQGAASLLPDGPRPALVWTFLLHADASVDEVLVERALVRNRHAWSYTEAQRAIDDGTAPTALLLLREVGRLRLEAEVARGGVSLSLPTQVVVNRPDGHHHLAYERALPVEDWNAQVSLLTGMAAAQLMAAAGVGVVRSLPPPDDRLVGRLRHTARALGIPWPSTAGYADVVHALDGARPAHAAFLTQAARALRGAGYQAVTPEAAPEAHAALAAPYAHVTAPLRRLVDRFANEVVLAAVQHRPPPTWAVDAIPEVMQAMTAASRRERAVERACVDAVECVVLAGREGERFAGVVVDERGDDVVVQLHEPAVVARMDGRAALGADVTAMLTAVDHTARQVRFRLV